MITIRIIRTAVRGLGILLLLLLAVTKANAQAVGATCAEWQPAYQAYLVANARAQPTINGLASPIIITKWKY